MFLCRDYAEGKCLNGTDCPKGAHIEPEQVAALQANAARQKKWIKEKEKGAPKGDHGQKGKGKGKSKQSEY